MSDITEIIIKSKVRENYKVFFIEDVKKTLSLLNTEKKIIYLIDQNIFNLFKEELNEIILNRCIIIESSEDNKKLEYIQIIINKLLELNVKRDDTLVAIGGGITQDLVTFISSILYRGIEWIFFPTTLLAQCDSCIGSKSSINFNNYKNLLGTFNPPSNIYIWNKFLLTLSESEIRSGIGEMLHYFLFNGFEIADELIIELPSLLKNPLKIKNFVIKSLNIKKSIIEIDEFDIGIRHLFNYGHTFGHALESITDYNIPHGQAITLGMDLANFISFKRKILSEQDYLKMHNLLKYNIPEFKFTQANIDLYLNILSKDKKNIGNKLGCILSKGPGRLEKIYINIDEELKENILEFSLKNFNK